MEREGCIMFSRAWGVLLLSMWVVVGCSEPPPQPTPKSTLFSEQSQKLFAQLHETTVKWLSEPWGRDGDGYTYAVDVGHLLVYAALRKDKELYDKMRNFAVQNLVVDDPEVPYTKGFVLWRFKEGEKPDASGTTEALRVAEGLWLGHKVWQSEDDRRIAIDIVNGYFRHEFVDQGIWMIRNYYNLGTNSFATNTFLVDYDPDFVFEVAEDTQDSTLLEGAQKCLELVKDAVAPSGLIYPILQPEVLTLLPRSLAYFAPNDIVKMLNSLTVVERVITKAPALSKKVLAFSMQRLDKLNQYYYASSGKVAIDGPAGAVTYAAVMRLAARLGDLDAAKKAEAKMLSHLDYFLKNTYNPRLYVAGEILLAFHYLETLAKTQQP
ncbi:MAG: hypothetical protein EP343_10510 [Deltaproteobacteria bacterium]|nr:MAG: hypothetical protein EP343_10510 [Deltaproteobacteria bacterium]